MNQHNQAAVTVGSDRTRALVAILALSPQGETTRENLIGLLWSDRHADELRNNLRTALLALLEDISKLDTDPLVLNGESVGLDFQLINIDVREFLEKSSSDNLSDLRRAADLYTGALLEGFTHVDSAFDNWLREARADLASRAIGVLVNLADRLTGTDRIVAAKKLVALAPLREDYHLKLMNAFIAAGKSAMAIRQYESFKSILKHELGVEIGAEMQILRYTLEL